MLCVILAAALAVAPEDVKTEESTEDLAAKVAALVKQLEDPQSAKRNEAEESLIKLGPSILEHLPPLGPKASAELKNRLQRVRDSLDTATAETTLEPKLVTLKGEMKATAALKAIGEQTGNVLIDFRDRFGQESSDPMITMDVEGVTFWEAIDKALDAGSLDIYPNNDEGTGLAFINQDDNGTRKRSMGATYNGPFRMEWMRVDATRDLRNPMNQGMSLLAEIAWEPRITPIYMELPLSDLSITADNGEKINVDGSLGNVEIPVSKQQQAAEATISIALPDRSVKTLSEVKGKIVAMIPGPVESFEFTSLDRPMAADKTKRKAGVTVKLESAKSANQLLEVAIRIRFEDAGAALESHRGWLYDNECFVVNESGKKIPNGGMEAGASDINESVVIYRFDLNELKLAKLKLVYQTPCILRRIPVDFVLKDVALP